MKLIYNKKTLDVVGSVNGLMTIKDEIEINVIPNFGGNSEDYEAIETDIKDFHLEKDTDGNIIVIDNSQIEKQLEALKPSFEEVAKAERQINLINDLTELGVI